MDSSAIGELEMKLTEQLSCSGSSVKIVEMDDKMLIVKLEGSCTGCPGAQITVKDTIETLVKAQFPTIEEVILDSSCNEEVLMFAKKLLNHEK